MARRNNQRRAKIAMAKPEYETKSKPKPPAPQSPFGSELCESVFLNDIIFDKICSHLEIKDLTSLRRTTRSFKDHYARVFRAQWSIHKQLSYYVVDTEQFRARMGMHNVFITGQIAFQFFDRNKTGVPYKLLDRSDAAMEMVASSGNNEEAFSNYLTEKESYLFDFEGFCMCCRKKGGCSKVRLFKKLKTDGSMRRIQISFLTNGWYLNNGCDDDSIGNGLYTTDAIKNALNTAQLNFITWNKAYCLFPNALAEHKLVPLEANDTDRAKPNSSSDYVKRGWKLETTWTSEMAQMDRIDTGFRRIGDYRTWKIDLPKIKVHRRDKKLPDAVIECSEFCIQGRERPTGDHGDDERKYFELEAYCGITKKHKYIYTGDCRPGGTWKPLGSDLMD
ncbi:hypothetical protein EAE96_008300 [Botrytis aclada]|nr:hypothetical protein EAE96_008300 [Botrytis aclada]